MKRKRQHYVPRAYLEAFTDPDTPSGYEPYIWVYTRDIEEPFARAPGKLAVRSYYYSIAEEPGEWDHTVEEVFSTIESQSIPVLRRLAEGQGPDTLQEEERGWLSYFIALMFVRIPAFRENIERFAADTLGRVARLGAHHPDYFAQTMLRACERAGISPPEDIEAIRQSILSDEYEIAMDPLFSLQLLVQHAPMIAQYVMDYEWRLLRANGRKRLLTSDRPVVLVSTRKKLGPFGWGTGWETPWMEATLPLDPRTCLLISLHHPEGTELIDDRTVDEINLRTASFAHEEVFSSRKVDIKSLNRPSDWSWWAPVSQALHRKEKPPTDGPKAT